MEITRTSITSGKVRTMNLDITEAQMEAYRSGALIQQAFPNLTDSQREFIMTGMTDEEWNETMAEPEDGEPRDDEPAF